MKVGDLVSIWDGEGDIYDPKSWPFGMVVREDLGSFGRRKYQVHWENDGADMTWYAAFDLAGRPPDLRRKNGRQQRAPGGLNENR